jgi:hypothetical protein
MPELAQQNKPGKKYRLPLLTLRKKPYREKRL